MLQYRFTCPLRNGLHARPASMLVEAVAAFTSNICLYKVIEGVAPAPIDGRSVLSIVSLDVKMGDVCQVCAEGADAEQALAAIRDLVEHRLVLSDELPPPIQPGPIKHRGRLPIGIRDTDTPHAFGTTACAGLGIGAAVIVGGLTIPPQLLAAAPGPLDQELRTAAQTFSAVAADLQQRATHARGTEQELLRAHASIAADPVLQAQVQSQVNAGNNALAAIVAASEKMSAQLGAATSEYIRERALDVQDVAMQLTERLLAAKGLPPPAQPTLTKDTVVFAQALTPNQLLKLDRRHVRALVLGPVGPTSHTIILARSLQIPTLIDVENTTRLARPGDQVVVDADQRGGFVLAHVGVAVARYYEHRQRTSKRRLARLLPLAQQPAITTDRQRLEVGANASTADEVAAAIGAEGVGLLRTELLFLDRDTAPSEEEQFEAYASVVRALNPPAASPAPLAPSLSRSAAPPTIIRTLDIGGDKPAPYLHQPREENPFLGLRGLRLYERNQSLLHTQLRAICRASALGPVKVMAPMVSTPGEAAWFRAEVRAVQAQLTSEKVAFDPNMPIGIMIEVPAAALVMDQLCERCDFFSIGTNDLTQYFLAVDRGNAEACSAGLYTPHHPSFLRLLKLIVDGAKQGGRWIGVCGEMAGQRLNLPLLIGLGVDEVSVAPGEVLGLKSATRAMSAANCREVLAAASNCADAHAVRTLLASQALDCGATVKVIDPALIDANADAMTKQEAIRQAVDLLYVEGRTDDPSEVEEAVWAREATYSTGLGYGFAVPHCKSTTVRSPTLAALKLRQPIDWGSMDGQPVRFVLLLAIPASDTTGAHMNVFAKLARKLMHEGFRDKLLNAASAAAVEAVLVEELGLT